MFLRKNIPYSCKLKQPLVVISKFIETLINEHIHMYFFVSRMFSWLYLLLLWQTQKFENKSPLSLKKKQKLLPAQFSVKSVMLPEKSIVLANWGTSTIMWVSIISLVFIMVSSNFWTCPLLGYIPYLG